MLNRGAGFSHIRFNGLGVGPGAGQPAETETSPLSDQSLPQLPIASAPDSRELSLSHPIKQEYLVWNGPTFVDPKNSLAARMLDIQQSLASQDRHILSIKGVIAPTRDGACVIRFIPTDSDSKTWLSEGFPREKKEGWKEQVVPLNPHQCNPRDATECMILTVPEKSPYELLKLLTSSQGGHSRATQSVA